MNNELWPFEKFTTWLNTRGDTLRERGFSVEIQSNAEPVKSVRLRCEKDSLVAELTVWANGIAHEAVLNSKSGSFIHEKDGSHLGDDWTSQLEAFFLSAGAPNLDRRDDNY